jgi:3-deoxy-D-manno-octulosonic-acid transferase/heptosyltransferase-1
VRNREILIIKLSAIGDVVHTLPSLTALHQRFPEANITWLVEEEASTLLTNHPYLKRVIVFKRKRWLKNLKHVSLWYATAHDVVRFIKEVRTTNYDLIIDFQGLLKSGLLVFLSRGSRKAGYDKSRELSYCFLNERIPPVSIDTHAVERYRNLVQALDAPPLRSPGDDVSTSTTPHCVKQHDTSSVIKQPVCYRHDGRDDCTLVITEDEKKKVTSFLRDQQLSLDELLVTVHTQARWATKRWDLRKIAELSDVLIERYGAHIIFTGAKDDTHTIEEIVRFMRHKAVNAAGKTTLKELAYLLNHSRLMITTDSGPMHIAAAMGTPVVALFGPTAPWRTGPYTDKALIVTTHLDCSPCFKRKCDREKTCMSEISVAAVLAAVDKQMGPIHTRTHAL